MIRPDGGEQWWVRSPKGTWIALRHQRVMPNEDESITLLSWRYELPCTAKALGLSTAPAVCLADLEEFIHNHRPRSTLTAATTESAWNGYPLTVFLGRGTATCRPHHSSTRDWSASLSSVIRFMRSTIS